mgnify:CR=1 FL=1
MVPATAPEKFLVFADAQCGVFKLAGLVANHTLISVQNVTCTWMWLDRITVRGSSIQIIDPHFGSPAGLYIYSVNSIALGQFGGSYRSRGDMALTISRSSIIDTAVCMTRLIVPDGSVSFGFNTHLANVSVSVADSSLYGWRNIMGEGEAIWDRCAVRFSNTIINSSVALVSATAGDRTTLMVEEGSTFGNALTLENLDLYKDATITLPPILFPTVSEVSTPPPQNAALQSTCRVPWPMPAMVTPANHDDGSIQCDPMIATTVMRIDDGQRGVPFPASPSLYQAPVQALLTCGEPSFLPDEQPTLSRSSSITLSPGDDMRSLTGDLMQREVSASVSGVVVGTSDDGTTRVPLTTADPGGTQTLSSGGPASTTGPATSSNAPRRTRSRGHDSPVRQSLSRRHPDRTATISRDRRLEFENARRNVLMDGLAARAVDTTGVAALIAVTSVVAPLFASQPSRLMATAAIARCSGGGLPDPTILEHPISGIWPGPGHEGEDVATRVGQAGLGSALLMLVVAAPGLVIGFVLPVSLADAKWPKHAGAATGVAVGYLLPSVASACAALVTVFAHMLYPVLSAAIAVGVVAASLLLTSRWLSAVGVKESSLPRSRAVDCGLLSRVSEPIAGGSRNVAVTPSEGGLRRLTRVLVSWHFAVDTTGGVILGCAAGVSTGVSSGCWAPAVASVACSTALVFHAVALRPLHSTLETVLLAGAAVGQLVVATLATALVWTDDRRVASPIIEDAFTSASFILSVYFILEAAVLGVNAVRIACFGPTTVLVTEGIREVPLLAEVPLAATRETDGMPRPINPLSA